MAAAITTAVNPTKLDLRPGKDSRIAEFKRRTADPQQPMEESYL
jgi:hypothetical protein